MDFLAAGSVVALYKATHSADKLTFYATIWANKQACARSTEKVRYKHFYLAIKPHSPSVEPPEKRRLALTAILGSSTLQAGKIRRTTSKVSLTK